MSVAVAAVTEDGHVGAASAVPIYATTARSPRSAQGEEEQVLHRHRHGDPARHAARVAGIRLTLQRHLAGPDGLAHGLRGATTNSRGVEGVDGKQSRATYYRVVATGVRNWLGTTSAARGVGMPSLTRLVDASRCLSSIASMDAITTPPAPVNEPNLNYAPGSPERAGIEAELAHLRPPARST